MLINICFDLHACIIKCNMYGTFIEEINSELEKWLYEKKKKMG